MTPDAHNSSAASGGCIALALIAFGFILGVSAAFVWIWWWS